MTLVPKIRDFDDVSFDPFLAEVNVYGDVADIYSVLAEARHLAPVHSCAYPDFFGLSQTVGSPGMESFSVLTYDLVSEVLADPVLYSNEAFSDNLALTFGHTISAMDAPEHSRYRRILQRAFLPQNVARWGETLVDPVVQQLLDKFIERGSADLIEEFTQVYPFEIIYRQLSLPKGDGPVFHRLAVAQNLIANDKSHALEASAKLGEYFAALVAERRKSPGDDLASALITATVDGECLPEEVIISFLRQLVNAAGDTTFRGTSVFLTGLLQNPDQLLALRANRTLMPQAIEEALRWESPVASTVRQATRDTELGGCKMRKGDRIYTIIGSANREERYFSNPDAFDIFRERTQRNVAFAIGPHICLGQHLARLEMTRAVNAILDRLPNLRLDTNKAAPVIRGINLRYPKHLYVRFDA
jgi:cytochrome P450